MLVVLVCARFPELSELARKVAASISDPVLLPDLVMSVDLTWESLALRRQLLEQADGRHQSLDARRDQGDQSERYGSFQLS
ncbi:hypothetical protein [Thermogemmatispora sp.]|uniref:hypothetical protein n=1 Tax=Thermogemmatispora sp. TaxID=1968838 RepID=UPI0035E40E59